MTEPCTTPPRDICLEKFAQIMDKLDELHESQTATQRRLFFDNGATCLQSKVNNNSKVIKILMWVLGFATTAELTVLGWMVVSHLKG